MTQARFELDEYTVRVLDVIKGIHGLKSREEAFIKFTHEFGGAYVKQAVNEDVLKEMDMVLAEHKAKYGKRKMSMKELDKLLE